MRYTVIFSLFGLLLLSCAQATETKAPSADDVLNSGKIIDSKIYHNPVSADKPLTKDEAAVMSLEELAYDFGKIKEGDIVEHIFKFKNTGKAPLMITSATGSCGCTVPKWPKDPVLPGETGEIKVAFDTKGRSGSEEKEVYILANTIPNKITLRISALVLSNP